MGSLVSFLAQHNLLSFAIDVARIATWLVLLFVVFGPLEWLFAVRPRKLFRKSLGQDVAYYFINGLVPAFLLSVPLALVAVWTYHLVPWRMQAAVAAWPLWQRVLVGFVVGEVGFYWGHRWAHEIPLLWRFHSIHHSAEHVFFLTSARAHPIDNAFIRLCGMVPCYVLGVASPLSPTGSLVPALIVIVATMWGFFIHANVRWRLGPFEWLIATPGFHHWHHTLGGLRDRNFASMMPVMDMIFGTYHAPLHERPAAYGIEKELPRSLIGQLIYPFTAAAEASALPDAVATPPSTAPRS